MANGTTRELSRLDMAVFGIKSTLLKARRLASDGLDRRCMRWRATTGSGETLAGETLAEVVTPLYSDGDDREQALQLGKVQNLRVAARAFDGVVIPTGRTFSFWAQLGRPTRARGFVVGRELRQGCLIPTLAGGICQLSNSLYRAASQAGCRIVERHGHTAAIAGSPFPPGEDATVYWNYVDLRFEASRQLRVVCRLTESHLIVRLEAA